VTGRLPEPGLRTPPPGLPDPNIQPPNVAESGDPFAALRIIDLIARLERGRAVLIASVVDRLNSAYVDWLFDERVVADVLLQLQANWMADYRNTSGIVLEDVDGRLNLTIEDSSRVDPWIVRQAIRQAETCRVALAEFSRRDRLATGG
jgi:hypothetical protein